MTVLLQLPQLSRVMLIMMLLKLMAMMPVMVVARRIEENYRHHRLHQDHDHQHRHRCNRDCHCYSWGLRFACTSELLVKLLAFQLAGA